MKYKLIASDMDGTLVNDKSELTERTKNAILRALDAGVYFVTATGRPFSNARIVNDLFKDRYDMPFIVFNGAAANMGQSGDLLFERFLDFDLAKEAFDIGQELGIAQILWTGPRLWANRICKETNRYHSFCKGLDMTIVTDLDTIKDEVKGISKVLWIDDPAYIKELFSKMRDHFGDRLRCVSSMSHFLEFVSMEAGKGTALAEIGRLLNIDKNEMIAVGDAYNDLCMIKYAGFGVAMENSPAEIKFESDYIAPSNNDDGVADVIDKMLLWNSLHDAEQNVEQNVE